MYYVDIIYIEHLKKNISYFVHVLKIVSKLVVRLINYENIAKDKCKNVLFFLIVFFFIWSRPTIKFPAYCIL